ncbi:hypothetical protein MON38_07105 [Hymenobacter sp. DH14]|uniref:Two component regulator propeller n=1 Tax=Hymenobacter cyanobacteriorum TaxID=2926463 RepID=A0A9X1VDK1_9BACT|nr:two-component regulator propeller domain-containing protein [Hymenobacter cyanobacteriorum]MCI1187184.1 hypothetical protein [Hymenobacter cyanobacteriorum]
MKIVLILILFSFFSLLSNAQRNIELISKENSELPEDDIWSIAIDPLGNKWFGTSKSGLVKFNNSRTKVFSSANSIIKGGPIGALLVDSHGILWISTSNPDGLFTIKGDSVKKIKNKYIEGLAGVIAMSKNAKGEIYFGGSNGMVKFDGATWSKMELPINGVVIRAIDVSQNGIIAVGHNDGLLIGTEKKWQIFEEEKEKLQLPVVRSLKFTSDTTLIIGYGGGFGNGGFSVKNKEVWVHYNKLNSKMPDNMVRDIEIDGRGNYWMATNNGLATFSRSDGLKSIFFRNGTFKNVILDICIENNIVWIATNFGVIKLTE